MWWRGDAGADDSNGGRDTEGDVHSNGKCRNASDGGDDQNDVNDNGEGKCMIVQMVVAMVVKVMMIMTMVVVVVVLLVMKMLTVWTSPTVSSTFTRMTVHGDISSRATSLTVNLPHFVLIKASCGYKSVNNYK